MDISPSKTSAPEKSQSLSPTLEFLDPEETQSEEKEIELKEDNQQTNGSISPLGTTPLATPSGSPSEDKVLLYNKDNHREYAQHVRPKGPYPPEEYRKFSMALAWLNSIKKSWKDWNFVSRRDKRNVIGKAAQIIWIMNLFYNK